jgi:hypothetical protein
VAATAPRFFLNRGPSAHVFHWVPAFAGMTAGAWSERNRRHTKNKKPQRFNHLPDVPHKRLKLIMNRAFLIDSQAKTP